MIYYVVQMVHSEAESSACVGKRIGQFASESDALNFASAAYQADTTRGCELVVRKEMAQEEARGYSVSQIAV